MSEQSISAVILPSWVKAAARCGIDIKPILQDHGIEVDLTRLENYRLPLSALDRVLLECVARARGQHFPFAVGEAFAFEYLPDLEVYLTTSSSLRDAAKVFEWLPALVNPVLDARLEEDSRYSRLALYLPDAAPSAARPYYAEAFFASITKFVRALAGDRAQLVELRVQHAAPEYAHIYTPYFGVPICFGAARNELVLRRGALDRPLEGHFPALHQQARDILEDRVAQLSRRRPVSDRVRDALSKRPELLAGGVAAVAEILGMSARTLQRRLQDESSSYGKLADHARFAWAKRYLARGDDLETISEVLGFSDRRSFTRAFKRWSGVTPSAFRHGQADMARNVPSRRRGS